MSYKSILTVVSDAIAVTQTLGPAISVARQVAGHLEVLCLGIDDTQVGYSFPDGGAMILEIDHARARDDVAALESTVTTRLVAEGLPFSVETAVAHMAGLSDLVARRAQFADLVVLPKPYGGHAPLHGDLAIEAALFQGRAPVLVMPAGSGAGRAMPGVPGTEIVVAWNESAEAMVAIRAALPLLRTARNVTIAVIDPSPRSAERSDPGGALARMLARHGVRAEVAVLALALPRVTDVLNRLIRDKAADLLVMGAYGHSRLRESVLGGATRDMLEQAEIPVFMAH